MAAEPRLKIKLYSGWNVVENEKVATYVRISSHESGTLQFSFAQHRAGPLQNVTDDLLLALCRKMAAKLPGGNVISERSGACNFGRFGTVVARGDSPKYFQVWVISNQREFILITHTCASEPDPAEILEANEIALLTSCE